MFSRMVRVSLVAASGWLAAGSFAFADQATIEAVQTHLYAGRTAEAVAVAEARLVAAPDDDQTRFALGAAQFLQAVEHLGQSFHRHGLASANEATFGGLIGLPFLRVPVPPNPNPEQLTYEGFRAILQTFVDELATAEATLAEIDAEAIDLPMNIGLIHLDMNSDGQVGDNEALWEILQNVAGIWWLDEASASQLHTDFDASDVPWLQSYSHLLMAIAEFLLAHDWQMAFDTTFHSVFPDAGLPSAALNVQPYDPSDLSNFSGLVDLVAFIHLNHWEVIDEPRLIRVLAHLEAVPGLSRENWERILAETDRGREWIPNPSQTGIVPDIQVRQQQIEGWMLFLDEFEAMLQGEKLLPHWRFDQGLNLRRFFTEPTTFDLVLLIQGSAALPYLEDGELASEETWRRISQLLDGDLFRYAVWFN